MSDIEERYIGLQGSGNDTEFDIVRETDKAYMIRADDGFTCWMPKSAFEDDGSLKRTYYRMLDEKIAEGGIKA